MHGERDQDAMVEVRIDSEDGSASDTGPETAENSTGPIHGVVIGALLGFDGDQPLVAFPGNLAEGGVRARSTCALGDADCGREVALLFEAGDPARPLIVGPIHHPDRQRGLSVLQSGLQAKLDGERMLLSAAREIVLVCGKASITLTRAGKILLRGAYISSRSSGVNKVKGGSIQLN